MLLQDTTPAQVIPDFHDYMTISRNKAVKTAYQYCNDLRRFAKFIAPTDLQEATTEQIEEWKVSLLTDGRNQPQSVCRKIAALSAFYLWLKKKKKARKDNPAEDVEKPNVGWRLPKIMSEDEVTTVLAVVPNHKRKAAFLNARDRAIMEVLYGSGLRRFEVCNLDLADIDLADAKLCVRHGKGDKERYSFLSGPSIEAIRAYLAVRPTSGSEALFLSVRAERMSPRALWQVFRTLADASGIKKHIVPHTMRHAFATHLYEHTDGDIRFVQEMLGHSNINTTCVYAHVSFDRKRALYNKAHPRAA